MLDHINRLSPTHYSLTITTHSPTHSLTVTVTVTVTVFLRLMKEKFDPKDPKSLLLRTHCQTRYCKYGGV